MTAEDVKFSLERQMSPESLSSAKATLKRIIKDIEVVDDLTVKIHTNGPQIGLPAMLSRAVAPEGAIMPKKYIEKVGEEEFRKKPIGSGPWKFVRSVPGDRIEFEAVDYPHWRGTPHFKNLQILLVPEESTRVSMVRTGEAAIASMGPETMRGAAARRAGGGVVPGTMQGIFQFWGTYRPEQKDNPIANPKVRQALSLAIDRKQIIEHVMNGKASMPYPFAAFGYTEYFNDEKWRKWADEAYRYDPAQAKKLLAEAGYPNGFELKFANTALPGTPFMTDIGTAIADMWNKIGDQGRTSRTTNGARSRRWCAASRTSWRAWPRCTARPAGPTWRGAINGAFAPKSQRPASVRRREELRRGVPGVREDLQRAAVRARRGEARRIDRQMVKRWPTPGSRCRSSRAWAITRSTRSRSGSLPAIPGRHELGDVFERMPRPDEQPWKK